MSKPAAGVYKDYSSAALVSAAGTKILFFYAPWSQQCRTLDADIKTSNIPDGVTILKVDFDSNRVLRQKYNITLQNTLVTVDDTGHLLKKYVAYDEPTFDSLSENML